MSLPPTKPRNKRLKADARREGKYDLTPCVQRIGLVGASQSLLYNEDYITFDLFLQ